jgi:hypothetical protein
MPEMSFYVPPIDDLCRMRKALVYRQMGTVNDINHLWKFCIIRPTKDTALTENDNLHIL